MDRSDSEGSVTADEGPQLFSVPSVDDQFKSLPPSREILEFYRNKLKIYEKEFTMMTEKFNSCKLTFGDGEVRLELQRCFDEIFSLQKNLSDVQVFLYQERGRGMNLQAENDMLKIEVERNREKISLLLSLCDVTEEELITMLEDRKTEFLPKEQELKKECMALSETGSKSNEGCTKDPDVLMQRVGLLERHLKRLTTESQDEIYTLHVDREMMQMEREKEYKELQAQITDLTTRLITAHTDICELTAEIITMKRDSVKKEEKWMWEKEKDRQHKLSSSNNDLKKTSVKSNTLNSGLQNSLKDQLERKEKLIRFYKCRCLEFESELTKMENSRKLSTETHQDELEFLNEQMTYMKEQYQKISRRRNLEAEGFRTDVRMLKEDLSGLEKKLTVCETALSPQNKELVNNSQEVMVAAKQLEREMELVTQKFRKLNSLN